MKARFISGIVLLLLLSAGTWAQDNAKSKQEEKSASAPADQSKEASPKEPVSVAGPDYVIGADDSLHISVWKEPDLTNTLPVRPDGKISMPLLNDVQAGKGLAGSLLKNEQLASTVSQIANNLSITSSNLNRLGLWGILWQHKPPRTNAPAQGPVRALAAPKNPFDE